MDSRMNGAVAFEDEEVSNPVVKIAQTVARSIEAAYSDENAGSYSVQASVEENAVRVHSTRPRSRSNTPPRDYTHKCPERLQSLIPPENFGAVLPRQIYRSSFPQAENYAFLKSLKLKTVLTVVPEPYPDEHVQFMRENGIQHITVHIRANKEEIRIDTCQMAAALGVVLDRSNYPLLIHCNKGKHRTGCVVGSFRKVLGESMENIIAEYHAYAGAKARTLDERFLETFDERVITWLARSNFFLPPIKKMDGPLRTTSANVGMKSPLTVSS